MVYCKYCAKHCSGISEDGIMICCPTCGRIVAEDIYSTEAVFVKTAGGSELAGRMVQSVRSAIGESHERTLKKGKDEILQISIRLQMGGDRDGSNATVLQAHALYKIAVERNFTRARRTSLVAAACLYIACRQKSKPYLLIDFSEYTQQSLYALGSVFLQLCKLLKLEEHPFVQKPVDPSLFIDRFTHALLGEKNVEVSTTAMRIIASMKRDWMQTGRKPSGLCGAALYISALAHGFKYSKFEVVNVVHVCEQTLTSRLIEFENTESAQMTVEELTAKSDRYEFQNQEAMHSSKSSVDDGVLCEHKEATSFAHRLCCECYKDFIEISGGLSGGAEPPAFQRAEKQRAADAENGERSQQSNPDDLTGQDDVRQEEFAPCYAKTTPDEIMNNGPDSSGVPGFVDEAESNVSESLSDIDDDEVNNYLHTEEEKHLKKIIWETMNDDYVKEQAAKEAAALERKNRCKGDISEEAEQLAAAVAAAVSKSRKEKQQKRAEESRNSLPPRSAAEATSRMLVKKRLSSRINFDVLEKLFDDNVTSDKTKRPQSDDDDAQKTKRPRTGNDDLQQTKTGDDDIQKHEKDTATEIQDVYPDDDDDCEEDDTGGGENNFFDYENQGNEYYDFDGYDIGY